MSTTTSDAARVHREALVEHLKSEKVIQSDAWHRAFSIVPREVFVPRWYEQEGTDKGISAWREHDATSDDSLPLVYRDVTLVTSLDPDTAEQIDTGLWTGIPTSSSTLPSVLAPMLEELGVENDTTVLHLGTGPGYLVALLCARLGDRFVYSMDIDPAIVRAAQQRLASIGYEPHLVSDDGRGGYPTGEQFDRIISTCSLPEITDGLMRCTKPGTVIVTNIGFGIESGVVRLVIDDAGGAAGHFTDHGGTFMAARGTAQTYPVKERAQLAEETDTRTTSVSGADFRANYAFRLLLAAELRGAEFVYHSDSATGALSIQLQQPDGTWARSPIAGEQTVTYGGAPSLWRTVEQMWAWWTEQGRPEQEQFDYVREADGLAHITHRNSGRRWNL
ncbi:methyltransferase domain-containing protein [Streptomyces sp. DSM 41634]|uniref:methyltransferase domain-containing protein n=1 Tax=Streptomyces sp. DSM 41634 TaxID=3448656 RepID=UPI00403FD4CE